MKETILVDNLRGERQERKTETETTKPRRSHMIVTTLSLVFVFLLSEQGHARRCHFYNTPEINAIIEV